jgi:hypothetical protein
MKKLFLSAALAVGCLVGVNAQSTGFEAGAYVGIPVGDAGDLTSFNFGITAAYYWEIAPSFQLGALTGYDYWTAKEYDSPSGKVKGDDFGFIPIAASAKYNFGGSLFGGLDLGYAIYAGSGDGDGGFLYQPKFGYSGASFDAFGFYKGISADGVTFSSVGAGFAYKF